MRNYLLKPNLKQIASTLPFVSRFSLCTLNLLKNAGALRENNTTITYACAFYVSDVSIPKPVTGRFANVSVRQRMKSFRQRLMSVRQRL